MSAVSEHPPIVQIESKEPSEVESKSSGSVPDDGTTSSKNSASNGGYLSDCISSAAQAVSSFASTFSSYIPLQAEGSTVPYDRDAQAPGLADAFSQTG